MGYIITSLIIWILYSFFEGVREANAKHHKEFSKSLTDIKIPIIYTLQRIIVLIIINLHLLSQISWWSFLTTIAMVLIFPYIHNGTYFLIRNKLNSDIFIKGPCDNCQDSEERPSMYLKHTLRTKLAVIALIIISVICSIK